MSGDSAHQALLEAIDQAYDRSAWHGPNLRHTLWGVTAREASWRPAAGRHSIAELVVHAAYWKFVARRRLSRARGLRFPRPGANFWPRQGKLSQAAWKADLALLDEEHRALRAVVAALAPGALARARRTVVGVAMHDVYHAGQVQLLKLLYRG